MAKYDFKCLDCQKVFEIEANAENGFLSELKCPHCASENIQRVWSSVPIIYKTGGFYSKDNRKRS